MPQPVRRGRPRNTDVDARITAAALTLLTEGGLDGFSIEEIATRTEVAKTTIYRRWPTRDHLLVDVVARVMDEIEVTYSGDLRGDLTAYLTAIVDGLHRMRRLGMTASAGDGSAGLVAEMAAAAARHSDVSARVHDLFAKRNSFVLGLIEAAKDHGELPGDIDAEVLFDQLAGALYYRLLVTGRPIDHRYVERLIGNALHTSRKRQP